MRAGKQLSLSRPRMTSLVYRSQARFENVRVDLSRRQIRMAEHHLDRAEVRSAFEQVRRERMPHDMRAQRRPDVGLTPVLLEQFPETDAAQRAAARVHEQPRRRPPTKQVAARAGLIRA